jgi:WD40 repeat protein
MPTEAEPYVGPRFFKREDQAIFFGRSREANELLSLVISHSEVLLYAQSGAGKTSLINAKLEPLLEEEEFEVLPVARMRTGVAGWQQLPIANVYVFHTLVSWAGDSLPVEVLAGMTIPQFLKQREQAVAEEGFAKPPVAIFDQFEELFTLYPEHWKHRRNFFEQLRDALNSCAQLRVLFSMREDYIASIDPYARILPEGLRVRFHLENLRQDSALKAVTGPLTLGYARRFAPGVAGKLVENLMTVELETAIGATESIISEFVEPLQLQVVCQRLWRDLRPEEIEITSKHLETSANIEKALLSFYEESIKTVAQRTGVSEAALRTWFQNELITPAGTRGMVFRGHEETGGIPNAAVDELERLYLIQAEFRGGSRWYELTHDRFIDAIQTSRQKWLAARAGAEEVRRRLQHRAEQWQRTGRSKSALLDEGLLNEAERWLVSNQARELGFDENIPALVDASRATIEQDKLLAAKEKQRIDEQLASAKRLKRLVVGLGVACLFTFVLLIIAVANMYRADEAQRDAIEQRDKASDAHAALSFTAWKEGRIGRARDLLSDFETRGKTSDLRNWEWYYVRGLVDLSESSSLEIKHPNAITCLIPLAGGKTAHFVTATYNGEISLWEASTGKETPVADPVTSFTGVGISYEPDATRSVKITEIFPGAPAEKDGRLRVGDTILKIAKPDGSTVEVSSLSIEQLDEITVGPVGSKFQLEVRHADGSSESIELVRANFSIKERHSAPIFGLAASQDGRRLASIDADGWFSLWDLSELAHPKILQRVQLFPTSLLAFSPKGDYVVAAKGTSAKFIPLDNASSAKSIEAGTEIRALDFSSNDGELATGTFAAVAAEEPGALKLWDTESQGIVYSYHGNCSGLSFSRDAGNLAALINGSVMLFSKEILASSDQRPLQVKGDIPYRSAAIALNGQGSYVAAGGSDGVVRVWKASDGSSMTNLAGHRGPVFSVAFDESGQYLASVGRDRTLRIWNLRHRPPENARRVDLDGAFNLGIAYSSDGMFIATADPYSGDEIATTDSETGRKTKDTSGLISILDSVSGRRLRTIRGSIWRLAFARDIPLLPIPGVDGTIRIIDVRDESEFQVLRGHQGKVKQAVFSPDGTKLLSGGMDGTVLLWDIRAGSYEMLRDFGEQIRAVSISPNGDLAACAARDVVVLFNLKSRQVVGELKPVNNAYLANLEFSPDGALLVLGELDGRIRTWNMTNLKEERPFSGHTGPVWSLAFSPDGERLLTSGSDRKTFLWDVKSRRELLALEDAENIYGATFSADGSRVALTSGSQALLYDAAIFFRKQEGKWFYPVRAQYRTDLMQWQSAIRDLSEAIDHGQGDLALRRKRGEAYAQVGDLNRAIEDFEAALGDGLADPTARMLLCDALLARGAPGDRETYYKHLRMLIEHARQNGTPDEVNLAAWHVSLMPDLPPDIEVRAVIALLQDKAIAMQPQRYEFLSTYATLLYRAGDIAGARDAFKRAMSLFPRDSGPGGTPFDWVVLAMCCWQLNEEPLARKWLDETENYQKKVKEDPFFHDPSWLWSWDQIAQMNQLLSEAHHLLRSKDQTAK